MTKKAISPFLPMSFFSKSETAPFFHSPPPPLPSYRRKIVPLPSLRERAPTSWCSFLNRPFVMRSDLSLFRFAVPKVFEGDFFFRFVLHSYNRWYFFFPFIPRNETPFPMELRRLFLGNPFLVFPLFVCENRVYLFPMTISPAVLFGFLRKLQSLPNSVPPMNHSFPFFFWPFFFPSEGWPRFISFSA